MYKKLITACMAIAAFAAFVMPSTASATNDPTLTENGSAVPIGSKIVGTNVGEAIFTNTIGEGLVYCTTAKLTGELVKNSGGTVEWTIETSDFSGTGSVAGDNNLNECTASIGNSWVTVIGHMCLRSTPTMATDEFQVVSSTGTCNGDFGNVRFILGSTTIGECEYEATGPVRGDYTTGSSDTLTVRNTQAGSGSKKIRGGFLCPNSVMLKMSFSLETEDGTTVTIS